MQLRGEISFSSRQSYPQRRISRTAPMATSTATGVQGKNASPCVIPDRTLLPLLFHPPGIAPISALVGG